MSTFSLGTGAAAVAGGAIIVWTIALTAKKYAALPNRVAYPKNYGDGENMNLPRLVVWFAPAFQTGIACAAAWALYSARSYGHADPLVGLIVIDLVLFAIACVQRGVMLRPDRGETL